MIYDFHVHSVNSDGKCDECGGEVEAEEEKAPSDTELPRDDFN